MKRINCFIPYGKIEATRQTVAQLAESSLVSQIYLITDDPHAKAIYPCNLIRTENIWSTKTLREIAGYASAHYTLIYTKTEELLLGMYALERFVAIADDTRSGMVYSDYYEQKEGKLNPHPVIDVVGSSPISHPTKEGIGVTPVPCFPFHWGVAKW